MRDTRRLRKNGVPFAFLEITNPIGKDETMSGAYTHADPRCSVAFRMLCVRVQ